MTAGNIDVTAALKRVENLLSKDKSASPEMRAMMELLVIIINLLVAKLGINSTNSSIPPSKDPTRKRGAKKKTKGEKRKPGGQKGHNGSTLEKVSNPDKIEICEIDRRTIPNGTYEKIGFESRQVIEINISTCITEYRAEILEGDDGKQYVAAFPEGITRPIQYGASVKSQAVYMSQQQKEQIKWASCDMSKAYMGGIKAHCPNATLVIDRFHVAKALNDAVDEVRKEQWRLLSVDGRKAIKGLRWLLYRHSNTRTKGDTKVLNSLRTSNRRIHRAWVLKDEFEQFWEYTYVGSARKFAKKWITAALRSRLVSLRKFALMLRSHIENIITFLERRLTNAVGEGINRIIKIVKNRASGFRNLDAFKDMIYLTLGDLDIPAQIPSRFHTI